MEYDAILGMDWLSTHYAHIDCHQKIVTFKMKGIPEFTFEGVKNGKKMQVISAIKTMKLLRWECQGFLAAVKDKKEAELKLDDIAMVKGYPDVSRRVNRLTPGQRVSNSLLIYSQDQALSLRLHIERLQQIWRN